MRKKALLAAMMALVLLLSGCALIVKDEAVDNATEIIRMGDQVITKAEVKKQVQETLDYNEWLYSMYGMAYDKTSKATIAEAQESVVAQLKEDLAVNAKIAELGLDQLTEEELEEVNETAQANFESERESVKESLLTDTEGKDDETLNKEAEEKMAELGYPLEFYVKSATEEKAQDKLREYTVKDVTVTEEEIQQEFESRIESQKTSYEGNPGSWADTQTSNPSTVYYVPAGVRRVKQILIKFTEEDQAAIEEAQDKASEARSAVSAAQAKIDAAQAKIDSDQEILDREDDDSEEAKASKEAAQADMDAARAELDAANQEKAEADKALEEANQAVTDATEKAYANIDGETDAVLASLDEEGADWQAIMDEKNQDPGMKDNEKGYAVAEGMTSFDAPFVEAAMALEKVGDHSGKVRGVYGYYIIRYDSDEPEGPVALDDVRDVVSEYVLSSKQTEAFTAAKQKWVEEAGIKVDMNSLRN